jgi:hypothetical protein
MRAKCHVPYALLQRAHPPASSENIISNIIIVSMKSSGRIRPPPAG